MHHRAPQVKLAIVDDHKLFRKGLEKLIDLDENPQYLILFEAEDGADMIRKIDKKALPDIVIMDIEMPGMDGYETVAWLQDHYPSVQVLVVSMVEKEDAILRMIRLGVKGYLSKDIEPADLHAALKSLAKGNYHYTDFLTGKLIHSVMNADKNGHSATVSPAISISTLTPREREFVKYACTTELNYQQIADKMFVAHKTVDGYRESVFDKLKVKSRMGLMLFALKNDLVTIK